MEGVGCPECKISKGEYRIKKWLKQHNISFEVQKTFKDAKYKDYLRWDFYIPSKNLLIEYNGRQHYEFVTRFHKSLMDFREDLERDILKKQYSDVHHFEQLVIPYTEYNDIEKILESTFF